jgi:tetratricopeptide (TPR) repeat protein
MAVGKYTETLPYFEKCLEKLPYWPYSHINMAILKGALGQTQEAEYHYSKALQYGHTDPEMYLYNAKWQIQKGNVPEAEKLVARGLEFSPNHAGLKQFQAQLPKTASPNEMVEKLRALCLTQPTPENWLNLSVALYQANDFQGCIDAAYQALTLRPNYDLAYNNICSGHIMLNQMDKAIAACEKALSIRPSFQRAQQNLNYAKAQKAKK